MLLLASRSVLIQAVSVTIPAYVIQCAYLPGKILNGIDRVNQNIALLAKLNWRLATEKEALWAKVLRQKYCTH